MIASRATVQPPRARSLTAARAGAERPVAPERPDAVTMIGADAVSTRAKPPIGAKNGSGGGGRPWGRGKSGGGGGPPPQARLVGSVRRVRQRRRRERVSRRVAGGHDH